MRIKASEFIKKALSYEGLTEWPSGSNNVVFNTIYYGREVHDGDQPGGKGFYPWCVTFPVSLFIMLGAREMTPITASSGYLIDHTEGYGERIDSPENLRAGDIAVLDFPKTGAKTDHTVIVLSNDPERRMFHTIEGNTGGDGQSQSNGGIVLQKDREYSLFVAAFRPNYLPEEEDDLATVLNKIATAAGLSEEDTISALGILCKFANRTIEPWETDGQKALVDLGLINVARDPREPVEMGELGVILPRLIEKIKKP